MFSNDVLKLINKIYKEFQARNSLQKFLQTDTIFFNQFIVAIVKIWKMLKCIVYDTDLLSLGAWR